jgi:hypothetical protein
MPEDLEDAIDELYASDPDGFIPARDTLHRRLRDEGRSGDAEAVRALRKPTVAAWAVDRLAHEQPDLITELLEAGDRLRRTQRAMASGRDTHAFHDAAAERRRLVTSLTDRAVAILDQAGRGSGAARDDIERTFEAASVDPDAGEAVLAGRLVRPLAPPSGFGQLLPGLEIIEGEGEPPAPRPDLDAARRAKQLQREADRAERELARAEETLEKAKERVNELTTALDAAKAELRQAEADRRGAALTARRARQAADKAAT